MFQELHTLITPNTARALIESVRDLSRDSYRDRQVMLPHEPLTHSIRWMTSENESRLDMWRTAKKHRQDHQLRCDEKFKNYLTSKVKEHGRYNHAPQYTPLIAQYLDWHEVGELPLPSYPEFAKEQDLEISYTLKVNEHNLARCDTHLFTLSVLTDFARETHALQHWSSTLEKSVVFYRALQSRMQNERISLILIEGDSVKIQALREEIHSTMFAPNYSLTHLSSYMGKYESSGTLQEDSLRRAAANAIEREVAHMPPSMLDLGL